MFRYAGFIVVPFLVVSCTGINQSYAKLKIQSTIDLENKTKEALTGKLFVTGEWPAEDWWSVYEDEQLSSFITMALNDSPSLSAVEAKIQIAKEEANAVRAKLFPSASGLFNLFWTHPSDNLVQNFPMFQKDIDIYTLLGSFDYEFDFWKKNRYQFEAALGTAKVAEAMWRQTKLVLTTTIAKQYFLLMSNLLKMQILEEILENRAKHLELVQLRKTNRIDNKLDLNQLREDVVQLQENMAALQEEVQLEKSLLFTLMGQNPDKEMEIRFNWGTGCQKLQLPKEIGNNLMMRRPDLIAEVWRVTSAAKSIGVAFANFFPAIDFKAFIGFQSLNISDLLKGSSSTESFFPNLNLPLFTGGKLTANYRAQVAAYESAVYAYNDLLLRAANEVVSSITKITSTEERLQYQNEEVSYSKEDYDLFYARYNHGINSMITVLQADEKFLWSKYNQLSLQLLKYQSSVDLVQALGGGYINQSELTQDVMTKVAPKNPCNKGG